MIVPKHKKTCFVFFKSIIFVALKAFLIISRIGDPYIDTEYTFYTSTVTKLHIYEGQYTRVAHGTTRVVLH